MLFAGYTRLFFADNRVASLVRELVYRTCNDTMEEVFFMVPDAMAGSGVMRGGVMRGGVMRGGVMRGGVMRGGVMRSGVMRGGVMRGGVMRGGVMRSGVSDIEAWLADVRRVVIFIVLGDVLLTLNRSTLIMVLVRYSI